MWLEDRCTASEDGAMKENYGPEFRNLSRDELDVVIGWAEAEGWNPGHHDAVAFWAADQEGYYGMFQDGELIGSASIVSYGGEMGFVGLFIVKPEWRGKGLGTQFWHFFIGRLRERLRPDAPAALDGVFAMQEYYAKSGFVFLHRNLRMLGTGERSGADAELVDLIALPFEELVEYDRAHFGAARAEFLHSWITAEGGLALGLKRGGKLVGMGVVRPCHRGFKIGPLFADDAEAADRIFRGLSSHAAGQPLFLSIPENNAEAVALAKRHGLIECFGCARMVMGPVPDLPWSKIYGVTSFELG